VSSIDNPFAPRTIRAMAAEAIAWAVQAWPALEGPYIRLGIAARGWRWPASLYWHSHEALERRLLASGTQYRVLDVEGLAVALDVASYTAKMRYFHDEPYEPRLTHVVASLQPGDVFVDVGANVGLFTLLAARRVAPEGRVIAFEPHPGARSAMAELLQRNDAGACVEIVDAALADVADGTAALHLACDTVLSTLDPAHSPLVDDFDFPESIAVPLTSLDAWMARRGIDPGRLRLVKIDVEGAEEAVVRGMLATLAAAPRARVVCETRPGSAADELLAAAGFTPRPLDIRRGNFGNYLYERNFTTC
jgi:FkbM family methyltransferase